VYAIHSSSYRFSSAVGLQGYASLIYEGWIERSQ
jgi:hypothetical protein